MILMKYSINIFFKKDQEKPKRKKKRKKKRKEKTLKRTKRYHNLQT